MSHCTLTRLNKCSALPEMGDHLAKIDTGQNWGGGLSPFWEEELGPHVTQCGLAEATFVPSGILIHPAVWPAQQTWAEIWGLCPLFGRGSWVPI